MSGLDKKGTSFPNGIQTPFINLNGVPITNVSSANGVAAAGANPTKAEYDVVVTLLNEEKTKLNAVLAALRTAGIISP